MERAKTVNEDENDGLPFSFLKKEVDAEKIKQHWERIKKEIEGEISENTEEDK